MLKMLASDLIEYLVRRKYPSFTINDVTAIEPSDARQKLFEEEKAYREELEGKSSQEIEKLYKEEQEIARAKGEFTPELLEESFFFNQRQAKADFAHWAKAPIWSVEEAVALSFGKNPAIVSWDSIRAQADISSFVKIYIKVRDLALRSVTCKNITDPLSPSDFIAWAKSNEIPFPKELEVGVSTWKDRPKTTPPDKLKKPLGTRERETALKLIIGMATAGYGYNPDAAKSSTVMDIVNDLQRMGITISNDTVHRWLKEAADFLPPNPEKT